jgi:hypothetical protein
LFGNAAQKGDRSHPKLNTRRRPIAKKYSEGKVKRTLKKRLKVLEIVKRESSVTSIRRRTVLRVDVPFGLRGRRTPPWPPEGGRSSRALGASAGRRRLGRSEKAGEKVGRVSALPLQLPFHTYLRTVCRDSPPGGRSGRPGEPASLTTSSARGDGFSARLVFLVSTSTKWLRSTRIGRTPRCVRVVALWTVLDRWQLRLKSPGKGIFSRKGGLAPPLCAREGDSPVHGLSLNCRVVPVPFPSSRIAWDRSPNMGGRLHPRLNIYDRVR